MPCLGNRSDLTGEIDRGGLDRQGLSPFCLVEALEEGHLARWSARNHAPAGQEPPHLAPKPAHLGPTRRSGGRLTLVIHLSPRRARL
jgi:hypothetical protein